MKQKILFLSLITMITWSCSFSQTKVYAYAQPVVGGANIQGPIDETGKQIKEQPRSRFNHYFFMRHNRKREVKPVAIWMDGKAWEVNYQLVDSTPVYITDVQFPATPKKITLVPKTRKKVLSLQLNYDKPVTRQAPADLQKLLNQSAIVFEYTCGGKTRYKALDKLTLLDPVATM